MTYEVLELVDGETVAELIAKLQKLPAKARITVRGVERISSRNLRVPVAVSGGRLAGTDYRLSEVPNA